MMDVLELIQLGEGVELELKGADARPEAVARELVALSNTSGGTILLGVADDGAVQGVTRPDIEEWLANLSRNNVVPPVSPRVTRHVVEGHDVVAVEVPRGSHKPYQTVDGKFWVRVGPTTRQASREELGCFIPERRGAARGPELSRLFQGAGLVHFDHSPVHGSAIAELDERALHDYFSTYYDVDYAALEPAERELLLLNADLLVPDDGSPVATVAGLLLFGRAPQRRLPHAAVVLAAYPGREASDALLDKKTLEGPLPALIDQSVHLIRTLLPRPSRLVGLKREDEEPVPLPVLREVMVNAVCHRDYSIANRRIQVSLFSDRLEVTSPGRLGNTLSIEKIRAGNSAPRNLLLLKFLDNMRYIDGLGRGIPMMVRLLGERLDLEEQGEVFRVTVRLAPDGRAARRLT